jgi:hypothetical protein
VLERGAHRPDRRHGDRRRHPPPKQGVLDVPISGRVATMRLLRLPVSGGAVGRRGRSSSSWRCSLRPAQSGASALMVAHRGLSAIGYRLSAIGYRLLANGYRLLAVGYWRSAVGYWRSAIGGRLSAVGSQVGAAIRERAAGEGGRLRRWAHEMPRSSA